MVEQAKTILSTIILKCGDCNNPLMEINVVENIDYRTDYLCDCWKCGGQSFVVKVIGSAIFAPIGENIDVRIVSSDSFSDGSTLLRLKTKRAK